MIALLQSNNPLRMPSTRTLKSVREVLYLTAHALNSSAAAPVQTSLTFDTHLAKSSCAFARSPIISGDQTLA
ncbi:hypothetical protein SAMN05216188_102194 [Lentzea xinjiangensis]|uniref:Uncharacterized protein n=1 Tax=Lentzea xinjiangensis TaxID=402600 RepID=A0A1H9DKU8_9PSEU|nr:hypothetical protein [Lentzea xinjiangensis]SEQ14084.1 hypothetical protein SAMN05216188_102194 [Lentzea xinjiangensis]